MTSSLQHVRLLGWILAPTAAVLVVAAVSFGTDRPGPPPVSTGVRHASLNTTQLEPTPDTSATRVAGATVEREQLAGLEAKVHSLQEENAALRDAMRVALERLAVLNAAEVPQVAVSAPHS
jgi:hypothetical protein